MDHTREDRAPPLAMVMEVGRQQHVRFGELVTSNFTIGDL